MNRGMKLDFDERWTQPLSDYKKLLFFPNLNKINNKEAFYVYLYNMNQLDALFIFNLFQYLTSTCFDQAYCSSSGGKGKVIPLQA
jgi:hypothetical protein